MRSNIDAVLMTLLRVLIFVKGWPVLCNFRCVYLPLVWRSYQPSCLLPFRPCLYSKIRCMHMLIYVSGCPVLSYVVFTTYAVCTSPWCGEIIFPYACCRVDRVCIAIYLVMSIMLVINLLSQASNSWGWADCLFMFLAERMANAVNLKCAPVNTSFSFYLPGYAVKFWRYADHAAVSAIYVRT